MIDIYVEYLNCWNCGEKERVEIPKGTTIDEFCDKNMCSNCGCHRKGK